MSILSRSPLIPLACPTELDLERLRDTVGHPLVSVLLTTVPGPVMAAPDRRALFTLVERAETRVLQELGDDAAGRILRPLRELAERAVESPTLRGLALFAGTGTAEAFVVPSSIGDRVIVDPTFATAELSRSLAEHPAHRVLALTGDSARLFVSSAGRLAEVERPPFPLRADAEDGPPDPEPSSGPIDSSEAFVRAVARAVAADHPTSSLPLFVVAPEPVLVRFRRIGPPVAGVGRGTQEPTPIARLTELVAPLLEHHLDQQRAADLRALQNAVDRRCARFGVADVWNALQFASVELLVVDAGFRYAARLAPDGLSLVRANDPDAPDVIDDVVDDIVETVISRGGRVRFVEPGSVHTGIAAVLGADPS